VRDHRPSDHASSNPAAGTGADLVVFDDRTEHDPVTQAALGPALIDLHTERAEPGQEYLRIYRTPPVLAFTGRDCASPGIGAAARAAIDHGFAPVRRGPGGRAAAHHRGALCLDHVGGFDDAGLQITQRFARFADLAAAALAGLGVAAGVGAVPGEYCPGEYSVHDGQGHKLLGSAQRLTRTGWLFSTVIIVSDPGPLRDVLVDVSAALDLDFDPVSVGAVGTAAPGVGRDQVQTALLAALTHHIPVTDSRLPPRALELAATRAARHHVPGY